MHKLLRCAVLLSLMFAVGWTATAQADWSAPDTAAIQKFEDEGLQNSRIMEVIGGHCASTAVFFFASATFFALP